jgi:hypothetical protein
METPLQEAQPSYSSHCQRDAYGRTDPKNQHLQQSKPEAPQAEMLGTPGSEPTLSTQISLPNYQPVNSNVQQMISTDSAGSTVEALETDGNTTGAEDLTWRKQHNAINPYAKQTFPRKRVEIRPRMPEHRVQAE